jgi:Ser-tRNA(Ala) deacylase AlaX
MHGTNSLAMKNRSLILKTEKKETSTELLELTRVMFMTGLIRMWRTSGTQLSPKNKLHDKVKRTVQVKRMRKIRKKKKHEQRSKFHK